MADDRDITIGTLLQHMQAMEQRLTEKIETVARGLRQEIRQVEANLTRQLDAIDKRLHAIEIEELPRRVKRLETASR